MDEEYNVDNEHFKTLWIDVKTALVNGQFLGAIALLDLFLMVDTADCAIEEKTRSIKANVYRKLVEDFRNYLLKI